MHFGAQPFSIWMSQRKHDFQSWAQQFALIGGVCMVLRNCERRLLLDDGVWQGMLQQLMQILCWPCKWKHRTLSYVLTHGTPRLCSRKSVTEKSGSTQIEVLTMTVPASKPSWNGCLGSDNLYNIRMQDANFGNCHSTFQTSYSWFVCNTSDE